MYIYLFIYLFNYLFIYLFIYFRLSEISTSLGLPISQTLTRDDITPDLVTGNLPPIPINYNQSGTEVTLANLEIPENMKLLPEKDNTADPIIRNGTYQVDFTQHLYRKYKFKVDVPIPEFNEPITIVGGKINGSSNSSVSGTDFVFSSFTYATQSQNVVIPAGSSIVILRPGSDSWGIIFQTNNANNTTVRARTVNSGDYYGLIQSYQIYLHLFYEGPNSSYLWYYSVIDNYSTDSDYASCYFNSSLVEFDIPV